MMVPLSPGGERAALEVRQTVVVTFQNLRYLLDSCLPILDKGLRLLDKGLLAVLTTNRSALSECALVLPRVCRACVGGLLAGGITHRSKVCEVAFARKGWLGVPSRVWTADGLHTSDAFK